MSIPHEIVPNNTEYMIGRDSDRGRRRGDGQEILEIQSHPINNTQYTI